MTLDDLITQCLEPRTKTFRATSGQLWKEVRRDSHSITLVPEYPVIKSDSVTLPLAMFESLGWEEVE